MDDLEALPPTGQNAGTIPPAGKSKNSTDAGNGNETISYNSPPSADKKNTLLCRPDQTPWWKNLLEVAAIVVGLSAVLVYGRQLRVMNRQLGEMQESGQQTDKLICLYRKQLAQLTKQAEDTHDLAMAAGKQADASKTIADKAIVQANATNRLAVQAARSADIASKQLIVAQREFETSQRPWLSVRSVSVIGIGWMPQMGGWDFWIEPKITYTNSGDIPAVNVHVIGTIVYADETGKISFMSDITRRQREYCAMASQDKLYDILGAQIVFPKGEKTFSYGDTSGLTMSEIRSRDGLVAPVLIGCIFYQFASSPTLHQTGFIFTLGRKDQSPLVYGQEVLASDVMFSDAWNGNATLN